MKATQKSEWGLLSNCNGNPRNKILRLTDNITVLLNHVWPYEDFEMTIRIIMGDHMFSKKSTLKAADWTAAQTQAENEARTWLKYLNTETTDALKNL